MNKANGNKKNETEHDHETTEPSTGTKHDIRMISDGSCDTDEWMLKIQFCHHRNLKPFFCFQLGRYNLLQSKVG